MKKTLALLSLGFVTSSAFADFGFSDIQNWTGSGSNRAAMVLDWNDGTSDRSLAWGYRWNGTVTAEQMLRDIDTADGHLALSWTFYTGFGYALTEASFDRDSDGTPEHDEGGFNTGTQGYWAYYVGGPSATVPSWTSSDFGLSTVNPANDEWEGLSWAPDFDANPPATPQAAPVPEPATVVPLGLGLLAVLLRRKRSA